MAARSCLRSLAGASQLASLCLVLAGCHLVLGVEEVSRATDSNGGGGTGALGGGGLGGAIEGGGGLGGAIEGGGGLGGVGGAIAGGGGFGGAIGGGGSGGSNEAGGGMGGGGGAPSVCGNGVPEGTEACDDGNADDNDACRNNCEAAFCGDGVVWPSAEQCDDTNADNTDACVLGCLEARCGDGFVRAGVEACDDGNLVDTDGCTNACALPTCGDGVQQAGEDCDDNNASNTDGCLNTCVFAACGDGFVRADGSEACDDGNADQTDGCLSNCTLPTCGDGFVRAGVEFCDDQNAVTGDGCDECHTVVQIAVKNHHACALSSSGAVKCWGRNQFGQLGQGSTEDLGDSPGELAALAPIALGDPAIFIAVGFEHSCAILDDGAVKCWGDDSHGQLGVGGPVGQKLGDQAGEMQVLPVVDLPAAAASLSLGFRRSCALLVTGEVYCWGTNANGALGSNASFAVPSVATPLLVDLGVPVVEISTFTRHTCARTSQGEVLCWGENIGGSLGHGTASGQHAGDGMNEMAPNLVTSFTGATSVVAGEFFSCVLASDGLRCWGQGSVGRLGNGSTQDIGDAPNEVAALSPVQLAGPPISVSLGRYGACALLSDGQVRCWGAGGNGALGNGSASTWGDAPNEMAMLPATPLGDDAIAVSYGESFGCALLASRRVKCWGSGQYGKTGAGSVSDIGDQISEMGLMLGALPLP